MPVTITKPLPTDTAAILDLLKARDHIAERLSHNPDFQALEALDSMIRDLRAAVAAGMASQTANGENTPAKKGVLFGASHADGAFRILAHFKRPMPIAELVQMLAANGLVVGGKDPPINLSSSLSKDDRFRSIRYDGRACWWLADEPVPEKEAAATGAAA